VRADRSAIDISGYPSATPTAAAAAKQRMGPYACSTSPRSLSPPCPPPGHPLETWPVRGDLLSTNDPTDEHDDRTWHPSRPTFIVASGNTDQSTETTSGERRRKYVYRLDRLRLLRCRGHEFTDATEAPGVTCSRANALRRASSRVYGDVQWRCQAE
jgi:hypothetical protein